MSDRRSPVAPQAAQTLDPEDWEAFRQFAHELVDAMIDRQRDMAEGPVWRPTPGAVKARIASPAPRTPTSYEDLRRDLDELVLPYATGNTHPRFWGWVHGSGTPGGALAEFVAAMLNANCGGRDHGAIYLERAVISWARDWFGLPATTGGLLVSGSSMANLLGLAAARQRYEGPDFRAKGVAGRPLVAYASAEAHASIVKAMEVLGLGGEALRKIPVDADYCLDLFALEASIDADRASGKLPFAIVATAGTVNTGAFDDLNGIADLCSREGLWMHVDGAFGALVKLAAGLAHLADGVQRADSIAFDFHKWLHVPYDAGCVLARDGASLEAAFGGRPAYLASAGALAGGEPWPSDLGIELSRGFRALKVWWTIKEQGLERLGAAIARNCAQAKTLAALLAGGKNIEISAPVPLNVVCCRYVVAGLDGPATDALNVAIVVELQESGLAAPSTTRLKGRTCIRICIANHRSRDEDFARLAAGIAEIGARLADEASR